MKGTEKQVKWAESIKAGWTERVEQNLLGAVLRGTKEEYKEKVAEVISKIKTIDDASWWIDNRQTLGVNSGNYADLYKREAMQLVMAAAKVLG